MILTLSDLIQLGMLIVNLARFLYTVCRDRKSRHYHE